MRCKAATIPAPILICIVEASLLKAGVAVVQEGRTALHLAALAGQASAVDSLCVRGADVKAVDRDGLTALHKAAAQGHTATVEKLLLHNAESSRLSKVSNSTISCCSPAAAPQRGACPQQDHTADLSLVLLGKNACLRTVLNLTVAAPPTVCTPSFCCLQH